MQRDDAPTNSTGYAGHPDASFHQVGSRRRAFETLRSAVLLGKPAPILITGESGAGKTALVRRFETEDPAHWRTASVDLAAEMNALEFLRLVGHALGASSTGHLGKARLRLERALANEAAEGRRWLLVVDRAHRGRSGVWDEVQAIANQLGRSPGFAALFIVGETGLARRLASRRSSMGLVTQVRTHVHLKPLDLDEARDLLDSADAADVADQEMLEELHRNSHGNTALLLRLAQSSSQRHRTPARPGADRFDRASIRSLNRTPLAAPEGPTGLRGEAQPDLSGEVVKEQTETTSRVGKASAVPEAPALIPSKPPIRDEDGLVEVGWEGDLEAENPGRESAPRDSAAFVSDLSPLDEELIEDRYAVLQAQSELTRNEGWLTSASAAHPGQNQDELPETADASGEARARPPESATGMAPGGIRAEGQHEFAPYSQLFTRYRQSN
jgi:type II secretory pathway predicted ATPase ExeA